ncbi:flavohemoglobin expression-modulating QEGLA motif protein [Ruegeria arenilitoris]|uniref:flavohemoglobin expression-modulating QEGLA motif protein n=1 Tax=Ruegeria arenilitoris TaxID=1173585 RepID=UPI00147D7E92|nr:tyrosine/phenylalanine carboxypeptidase domain-containing protein [Ruegeria arenilitoris]
MTGKSALDFTSVSPIPTVPFDMEIVGGRLAIEERHPFLCLHRGPKNREDHATAELLLGQASFAIAPMATPYSAEFSDVVKQMLAELAKEFHSVLLLEVYSLEAAGSGFSKEQSLLFECHVPETSAGDSFLNELERAILAENWPGAKEPEIKVAYMRVPHPETLRPLLTGSAAIEANIVPICLGLSPIYLDQITGEILPVLHREFQTLFGRVLKKALYSFCHSERVHLPPHYHALGRTRVGEAILAIDRELYRFGEAFDPLLLSTPVNAPSAWRRFAADHYDREPDFHYRPLPIDPGRFKRNIYQIPLEQVEDPTLHRFFATKRTELDRFATLLEERETERFVLVSRQIFGAPDDRLVALAKDILEHVPPHTKDDHASDSLNAEAFAAAAREDLLGYGLDPKLVETREDVPGLMVSRGRFLVGSDAKVPRRRLRATLDHEIGVHVLTHRNGAEQPFGQLRQGMAGYEELQEGLAVFAEHCTGGLTRPRWRQIAGRVVAVANLVAGAGFIDIFRTLNREYSFGRRAAFTMTMRVVRGGGFTKDMVYLRGLQSVVEHVLSTGNIEPLLVGKVSYDHLDILEEMSWRGLLRAPRFKPAVFEPERLTPIVEGLKRGGGLLEMARSTEL